VFISVIIATRNRDTLLARTLAALLVQQWPRDRFEIIVADNGSTDRTRIVVEGAAAREGLPSVRYLYVAQPGKSHAVNAAIEQARGDLLAFTDDDVTPSPHWLESLAGAASVPDVDFVAGRILPDWETAAPAWLSPAIYGVLAIADNGAEQRVIALGTNEHIMPIGANVAVRAGVVRRLGGLRPDLGKLDDTLRTGEDHEFFLRLIHHGCRGVYEPEAVVRHFVPASRLERGYFRRWLYQNGQDVAKVEAAFARGVPYLLRVPRYLWRRAAKDLLAAATSALRRDEAARFASALRVIWFGGYVREAWFGARAGGATLRLAEGR